MRTFTTSSVPILVAFLGCLLFPADALADSTDALISQVQDADGVLDEIDEVGNGNDRIDIITPREMTRALNNATPSPRATIHSTVPSADSRTEEPLMVIMGTRHGARFPSVGEIKQPPSNEWPGLKSGFWKVSISLFLLQHVL